MFPSLPTCFQMFPARETMFSRLQACQNNVLRLLCKHKQFVRANVFRKMFPSLPTVGNMTKRRRELMFPRQCFLVWPGLKTLLETTKYWSKFLFTVYESLPASQLQGPCCPRVSRFKVMVLLKSCHLSEPQVGSA